MSEKCESEQKNDLASKATILLLAGPAHMMCAPFDPAPVASRAPVLGVFVQTSYCDEPISII
jgi:hypothetical protein